MSIVYSPSKIFFYFHIVLQKYIPFLIEGCVVPKTNKGFDGETMIEEYILPNSLIPHYISELFGWKSIRSLRKQLIHT